jgi:hypothetical protein
VQEQTWEIAYSIVRSVVQFVNIHSRLSKIRLWFLRQLVLVKITGGFFKNVLPSSNDLAQY